MRASLAREWAIATGCPAFVVALLLHATVLAIFVTAWGDGRGVPLLLPHEFYAQTRTVQGALLAGLLPWAAARLAGRERGDAAAWLCAMTAIRPSAFTAARACAVSGALWVIVAAGLPVVLFARQMSGTPLTRVVRDECVMVGLALVAVTTALAMQQLVAGRLAGWLGAAAVTVLIAGAAHGADMPVSLKGAAMAASGMALLSWLVLRADTALRYLQDSV